MTSHQIQWQAATDANDLNTSEFVISRSGKRQVTGALWTSDDTGQADTIVLFGHGASGDRYQAPICALANRFLNETHLPVMSMDGPVHGLRQVGPGGRESFWPEWQRESAIDDMVDDWQCAITTCLARDDLNADKIAYFGLSMGSIFGIPLIAARDDVIVATLGLVGAQSSQPHSERLLRDAAGISCPLLFLMQMEDELFDRESYINVFDRFAAEDKRIHANPGLHPEIPAEEIDFAFDFMSNYISGTAERRIVNPLAE